MEGFFTLKIVLIGFAVIVVPFIIAILFRIIAKVIFKTYFEERRKNYEGKNSTRKNRET